MERYYIGFIRFSPDDITHHGIKGQKWGVRRFQNEDGTLTEAGLRRYGTVENFKRAQEEKTARSALNKQSAKTALRYTTLGMNITKKQREKTKQSKADYEAALDRYNKAKERHKESSGFKNVKESREKAQARASKRREYGKAVAKNLLATAWFGALAYVNLKFAYDDTLSKGRRTLNAVAGGMALAAMSYKFGNAAGAAYKYSEHKKNR